MTLAIKQRFRIGSFRIKKFCSLFPFARAVFVFSRASAVEFCKCESGSSNGRRLSERIEVQAHESKRCSGVPDGVMSAR